MKIKLTISERITLLSIFPTKNNYATMRIVNDLIQKIGISSKEADLIGLKIEGGVIKWNPKKKIKKEFSLGEFDIDIIKDSLKRLDEEKELKVEHLSLWNKFIKGEDEKA